MKRPRERGVTIGVFRAGSAASIDPAAGRADPDRYCVSCGLPTSGMTVDGLCEGCYDGSRPNVPRRDPRIPRDVGPFR